MNDLCIGHIHIQTAKVINNGCQRIEVYGRVIRNIQVKVCIQHGDRLLCFSISICGICLGIGFLVTESHVQKCITVNRCKFNVLSVVVDTCNNNCITVFSTKSSVLVTVVNTKQSVCGISGQCGGLRINGILYFLVYLNLAFVQYRLLDLVQFGIQLTVNIKSADKYQKYNNLNRKKYLFLF